MSHFGHLSPRTSVCSYIQITSMYLLEFHTVISNISLPFFKLLGVEKSSSSISGELLDDEAEFSSVDKDIAAAASKSKGHIILMH